MSLNEKPSLCFLRLLDWDRILMDNEGRAPLLRTGNGLQIQSGRHL